jgi:uncharacterized protein (DUF305 family)
MLTFPKVARLNRAVSTACAAALAAAILALASASVTAHEPMKADKKETSTAMDHSKMTGMHHMEGMSMTGDVDVDFAKNMRMHHQTAVTMARAQIKNSKDAQLIKLSRTIITAQNKEIATLDAWLNANKQRVNKAASMPH